MEQKNKRWITLLITLVIIFAVGASFMMNFLVPVSTPVILPSTEEGQDSTSLDFLSGLDGSYTLVSVTPETVQAVIATLNRPANYTRSLTIQTAVGQGFYTDIAQVWVDGNTEGGYPLWTRTTLTKSNGLVEQSIVEELDQETCTLYLWYGDSRSYQQYPADQWSADLCQRIPSYEDVLAYPANQITDTDYQMKEGVACIYVQMEEPLLGYQLRYWISVENGLLVAAETLKDDAVVLTVSATAIDSTESMLFTLPDGTVLHQAGS